MYLPLLSRHFYNLVGIGFGMIKGNFNDNGYTASHFEKQGGELNYMSSSDLVGVRGEFSRP